MRILRLSVCLILTSDPSKGIAEADFVFGESAKTPNTVR